ncbi:MAG TPA: hypothetical protein PKH33_13995 [bacterium]|nr:hypothetical protein [bacterium]
MKRIRIKEKGTAAKAAAFALAAALAIAASPISSAPKAAKPSGLPTGVIQFDTAANPDAARAKIDSSPPTTAAVAAGEHLWVGRSGGIRRFDRHSGKWDFFPYKGNQCPGTGTSGIFFEAPHVWARVANTGALCRLNEADGSWFSHDHWTVKEHLGPGGPVIFTPERIYIASQGGPEWQGVNIIDRRTGEWVKLLPSKPAAAMVTDGKHLWLGVPSGILRINRVTEEYTFFQPDEHGGGSLVNDIIRIPGGLAFATSGNQNGILGDETKLTRNSFSVYIKKTKRWHNYKNEDREKLIRDIENGTIFYKFVAVTPGLVIYKNGKWSLIDASKGLDSSDIVTIAADDSHLYVGTARGINVLDINTLKRKDVNIHIYRSLMVPKRLISDREYLWALNHRGVFRITKRNLFLSPQ